MKINYLFILKVGLSILLLLCLLDFSYGYYQFVRLMALIGFGILAYQSYKEGKQVEMIIFSVLALLFQPFLKISLGRTLWNIMDGIVAVGLILSMFVKRE